MVVLSPTSKVPTWMRPSGSSRREGSTVRGGGGCPRSGVVVQRGPEAGSPETLIGTSDLRPLPGARREHQRAGVWLRGARVLGQVAGAWARSWCSCDCCRPSLCCRRPGGLPSLQPDPTAASTSESSLSRCGCSPGSGGRGLGEHQCPVMGEEWGGEDSTSHVPRCLLLLLPCKPLPSPL